MTAQMGMMHSLRGRFQGDGVSAVLWRAGTGSLLSGGAAAGLAVVLQIAMTRMLGTAEFGRYNYVLTVVNLLSLLALVGFDTAALRFVAHYHTLSEWSTLRGFLTGSLRLVTVVGLLCGAGLWLGGGMLVPHGEALGDVMVVAAMLLPVLNVVRLLGSHIQGLRQIVTSSLVQSVLRPALIGALVLGIWLGNGSLSAPQAMMLNLGCTAVVLMVMWRFWVKIVPSSAFNDPPVFEMRTWLKTSSALMLIAGSQALLVNTDTLMLGQMRGTEEAGLYSVAALLVTVITLGITAANGIVAPMIAELNARGDREGLQRLLQMSARGVLAYAIPVVLCLGFFGKSLLGIYGEAFRASWGPMMVLAAGQLSIVAFGSVGFLLTMSGHEKIASQTIVASAMLNIILNLVLIPKWGAMGAASATAIATFARSAVLTLWASRKLGLTATVFAGPPVHGEH